MVYHVNANDLVGRGVRVSEAKPRAQQTYLDDTRLSKRVFDVTCALGLLVFFAPFIVGVAVMIWLTDRQTVLFAHRRIGQNGRSFPCYKFRTMCLDADEKLKDLLARDPVAKAEWEACQKLTHDPRLTPIGAILRKTSLDELPQLWNVIRGDMSMVGPRPIVEDEIRHYGPAIAAYASVRPGLTGAWQVSGRSDTTYEERVALDVAYVETRSLWVDFKIMLKTVRVVLGAKGAM